MAEPTFALYSKICQDLWIPTQRVKLKSKLLNKPPQLCMCCYSDSVPILLQLQSHRNKGLHAKRKLVLQPEPIALSARICAAGTCGPAKNLLSNLVTSSGEMCNCTSHLNITQCAHSLQAPIMSVRTRCDKPSAMMCR